MTMIWYWGGAITHNTFTSFPPGSVWRNGNTLPMGRLALNGNRPIRFYGAVPISASGYDTAAIEDIVGGALGSGYIAHSGAGSFRFRLYYSSGTLNFGRCATDGGFIEDSAGGGYTGSIPGYAEWSQAPTAPQSPAVLVTGTGEATVTWAAPSDWGAADLNMGYRVFYGTDPALVGASSVDVGMVTSRVLTGLTPGLTYYFAVSARNDVTNAAGTCSVRSSIVSASLGAAPGAPSSPAMTAPVPGLASLTWGVPASDGGVPITGYKVRYGTSPTLVGATTVTLPASARSFTKDELTPGTTYYMDVKAVNSVGDGTATAIQSATVPTRTALDGVKSAAVTLADGVHVAIRSDGANNPTLTLGYVLFGTGTTFTSIATLPDGSGSTDFAASGGDRNVVLVADPLGNLYVIGTAGNNSDRVLVRRYERTGSTTWVLDGVLSQALPSTGDPLAQFAATYVAGVNPTIFMLARRAGTVGAGALSWATLDLAAIEASSGSLFTAYGSDPSWLPTPPAAAALNSGVLDITVINGRRIGTLGNGFAVVDLSDAATPVATGVSKSANGTTLTGAWARILGVSSTAFVVLTINAGALAWTFYGTNGAVLGSGSYAGSNFQGGAAGVQWDAYYDRAAGLVTVYYIADDAGTRVLESIDISPVTYAASAAVNRTSALGSASTTNSVLRIAEGVVDERRVLVEAANITGASVKSVQSYSDRSGNVAPTAPVLVDEAGYDATAARVFSWAFGDTNPYDSQTAYELVIERVSDGVAVVSTGKVTSSTSSRTVNAATLTNGVNYRWRVRTYDALDTVSSWSSYDTFTTSATGTLTIVSPATDNLAGIDTSSLLIDWTYVQVDGYVQTQRRVRVVRTSDSVVLSDTTMQASAVTEYVVTSLPSDVEVRVEVSIVTNAPGTPTIGPATRLVTVSYAAPMVPTAELEAGESYIEITVTNPEPTGSRPATASNEIERRPAGGTEEDWVHIATIDPNDVYRDHAVRSSGAYEYRVRAVSA